MPIAFTERISTVVFVVSLALASTAGRAEERVRLVLTSDRDYPPISYLEDGQARGLIVDIVRAMEEVAPLRFDVRMMEWQEAQDAVTNGVAHVVSPISISPERGLLYDFTKEVLTFSYSVFCRQDDLRIKSTGDLVGRQIGVTPGGYPARFLASQDGVKLVPVATYKEGMTQVLAGKLDGFAADTWVGGYTLQSAGLKGIRMTSSPFAVRPAVFGVKKGDAATLALLEDALGKIRASGRLEQLLNDMRSQEVVFLTKGRITDLALTAAAAMFVLLVAGGVGWIRSLRRQVRRKTAELRDVNDQLEHRVIQRTQELRTSEDRFRTLVQTAPVLVVSIATDGSILSFNHEAEAFFGVLTEEVRGRNYLEMFLPVDERPAVVDAMRKVERGGRLQNYENVVWAKGKVERAVTWNCQALPAERGEKPSLVAVGFDVTERRQQLESRKALEDQLRQAEKMQALGQLAGGIAHDFNNQLGGILGFAKLLSKKQTDPKAADYCEMIARAARHSADLTRQLLAFARKGHQRQEPTDMHALVKDVVAMLSRSIDKSISITTDLKAQRATVTGDPALLQSTILNLAINARDAMPTGGTLTIATRTAGDQLEICVRDTGVGMAEEVQRRIFEPFFTTKEAGLGSGMGLALVHGTVHAHGGSVKVTSEIGEGSTFVLAFPLLRHDLMAQPSVSEATAGLHGRPRLLVVDDEPIVREATAEILRTLGGDVTCVNDGRQAIDLVAERPDAFDVIIMDLNMPVVGGQEAFAQIRALNGGVKIVICSGYAVGNSIAALQREGAFFLQKPYEIDELANLVNSLTI